jgi:hypothetical protein
MQFIHITYEVTVHILCSCSIKKFICRIERKFGIFSKLDACSFVANVYDDGNLVSIVTDCSPHATHVAGIAAAFHPEVYFLTFHFLFRPKLYKH